MDDRPPARRLAVWGARLALLALLAANVALVTRASAGSAAADVATGYALCAGLAAWAWYLAWRDGVSLGALVGPPPRDRRAWGWVALALPLLALSLAVMWAGLYLLSWVAPGVVEDVLRELNAPEPAAKSPTLTALAVAAPVLAGPVAEELFFRGALLGRWTTRWGPRRAVAATSLMFGVLHLEPVGAVVFGACMALLRRRTGTLLVPIACHAVHNALTGAAELLPEGGADLTLAELRAGGRVAVLALAAVSLGLWLAARRLARPESGPAFRAA